jgi:hypothetical protein
MKYGQMAYNAGNFKYLSVNSLRLSTDLKGATHRKDSSHITSLWKPQQKIQNKGRSVRSAYLT